MNKTGFYTHLIKITFYSDFIQMFGIPYPFSNLKGNWLKEEEIHTFVFHSALLVA